MEEYRESVEALLAENPEFVLLWKACDKVFKNRMIATANADGLSAFEKMMGIMPNAGDSDEVRRIRIWAKWNSALPYTLRALKDKLWQITGDGGFSLDTTRLSEYFIKVDLLNQTDEVCRLIYDTFLEWIPANMIMTIRSLAIRKAEKHLYAGTAFVSNQRYVARPVSMNQETKRSVLMQPYGAAFTYQKLTAAPKKG